MMIDEACYLLPYDAFPGEAPVIIGGEMELQELEDSADCRTLVALHPDGTVTLGTTDGPPPVDCCGQWQAGAHSFQMVIQRTFSADPSVMPLTMNARPMAAPIVYSVARVYVGSVNKASAGRGAVEGKIALFPNKGT